MDDASTAGDGGRATCGRCGRDYAPRPWASGLCEPCREAQYPPIEERGGRWSPLTLGVFSLFCDPLLIPTILTIRRGTSELGRVRRREQAGYWHPEHASVRTGAVWGIFLAAVRPLAVLVILGTLFFHALLEPATPPPVAGPSELDEVIERLDRPDGETRALARSHLVALGPSLVSTDVDRVLDVAEGVAPGTDAAETRTAAVRAALAAPPVPGLRPPLTAERLARVHPRLTTEGRAAVLGWLADRGDFETFVGLVADEAPAPADLPPALPVDALRRHPEHAAAFLPALLDDTAPPAYRRTGLRLAASFCRTGRLDATPAGIVEGLFDDWERGRRVLTTLPPADGWSRLEPVRTLHARTAAEALTALSCVRRETVDDVLERASRHDDPRVAGAAVAGRLRRGATVPRATVRRLGADPLSRGPLLAALLRHGGLTAMPLSQRRVAAVSEADLVRWLEAEGRVPTEVERLGGSERPFVRQYAVWRVRSEAHGEEHLALGPYPASAWARAERETAVTRWEDEPAPWHEGSLEALVQRARVRHASQMASGGAR
ncbi:MAG TPA: hypothetical protein RMH99_08985 [Sandaracinaceae bacterium LLY-WYZ-13_1]|nr:hypothetical protein [Sandaracinaceae bacterium LLY-WYZ-13_1]